MAKIKTFKNVKRCKEAAAKLSAKTKKAVGIHASTEDEKLLTLVVAGDGVPEGFSSKAIETVTKTGGKSVVPLPYKQKYGPAQNCGDEIAEVLTNETQDEEGNLDLKRLSAVAAQNDISLSRWGHLNTGMQRMNLGNVLRHRVLRGEMVQIGKRKWDGEVPTKRKARKTKKAA